MSQPDTSFTGVNGLFIFALAAGAPLLLWFAFSGGDADLGGNADTDGDGGGVMSVIPLSTLAFVLTFFGVTGLVTRWAGTGPVTALGLALVVGIAAGVLNSTVFAWLRRTEVSSEVTDKELEGTIARVALPVSAQHRGRIVLDVGGSQARMTAAPAPVDSDEVGEIEVGAQVIVVSVKDGVALVTRLAPELEGMGEPEE